MSRKFHDTERKSRHRRIVSNKTMRMTHTYVMFTYMILSMSAKKRVKVHSNISTDI
jgi:hypothetical protein